MTQKCLALFFTAALLLITAPAQSATVTYEFNLDRQLTGTAPVGWLTATFEDLTVPGEVKLTMNAGSLSGEGDYRITGWYFNINNEDLLGKLSFRHSEGTLAKQIGQYPDAFARKSDIFFGFPSRLGDPFGDGEKSVYIIEGDELKASMFNFTNRDGAGNYFSMAKIKYVDDSGQHNATLAAVPIPSAVLMLGAGLVGLVAIRRRHR